MQILVHTFMGLGLGILCLVFLYLAAKLITFAVLNTKRKVDKMKEGADGGA